MDRNHLRQPNRITVCSAVENCLTGYHVDHIQALAKGGLHHQDNLQYLIIGENCRKGKDRDYDKSKALSWQEIIRR